MKMFSRTTMELSTNMPTASARPAMEMTLSVTPAKSMTVKVESSDSGMLTSTMVEVESERRKTSSTSAVRSVAR
ncbi:MAG: hypothetical protein QM765_35235 [Myxococcales bacterium]